MLTKDKSTFDTMFSLDMHLEDPEKSGGAVGAVQLQREGDSDSNPIYLHGDTTDEFRALLWSLYAL